MTARSDAPTLGGARGREASGVRSGIIGMGFIGGVHAAAVRAAGGTLAAVADSGPGRVAALAAEFGAERGFASASELIESPDVDVVHVCTPNHLHTELATMALRAGKHVICEKPLATTAADAQGLTDLAQEVGVVTAVPFAYRYYPTVREARARVAHEDVYAIHGSYLQDWMSSAREQNWRVDPSLGGASRAFADIGVHWCDLVEFVSGHRIVRLTSGFKTAVPERGVEGDSRAVATEDVAALVFETDRGALGSLLVSQVAQGRKNRLWFSIDGSEHSYAFDQESPELLWVGGSDAVQLVPRGAGTNSPDAARLSMLPAGHPQGYQDCFNSLVSDVYAAIGGEAPSGMPTFADGLRAARLTESVLRSVRGGAWVDVPGATAE